MKGPPEETTLVSSLDDKVFCLLLHGHHESGGDGRDGVVKPDAPLALQLERHLLDDDHGDEVGGGPGDVVGLGDVLHGLEARLVGTDHVKEVAQAPEVVTQSRRRHLAFRTDLVDWQHSTLELVRTTPVDRLSTYLNVL